MKFNLFLIFSYVPLAVCATVPSHRTPSRRSISPRTVRNRSSSSSKVQIEIALVPSDTDSPEDLLLRLSDPRSPEYGRHWTPEQVVKRFAPRPDDVSAVVNWLREAGVSAGRVRRSHGGGHVLVHLTTGEVEGVFNTSCHMYSDPGSDDAWVDCGSYTVPQAILPAIEYIAINDVLVANSTARHKARSAAKSKRAILGEKIPTPPLSRPVISANRFSSSANSLSSSASPRPPNCDPYTTPPCLRDLYHIPSPPITPRPNNSLGIYLQSYMTWLSDDLDKFFTLFEPDLLGRRPIVAPIAGGYRQWDFNITPFNLEANLDIQYTMALMRGLEVTNLQVGDKHLAGNVNTMLAAFDAYYCDALDPAVDPVFPNPLPGGYNASDCGTVVPPSVVSISFAWVEADFARGYLERQCLEILKLGLMGVTVIVSSGDTGTQAGIAPGVCIDDADPLTGSFNPTWPAACPWITTVGGTARSTSNSSSAHWEQAWRYETDRWVYTSSGGFSNVFPAPEYQKRAVDVYKMREGGHLGELAVGGYHSRTPGRGFPDVAVMAESYVFYLYGQLRSVHGTSASAPVFASMIAMINNERLAAGKTPVGFINPAMYAHPEAFNDVDSGSNIGCGASPAYRATVGWDAVTGLGSPDYEKLRDIFVNL